VELLRVSRGQHHPLSALRVMDAATSAQYTVSVVTDVEASM
jgi:hypothetical protein